jgi:glutamyl-tRNA synthetase
MIQKFELGDVHKGGANFDIEKAKHFNHHYMTQIVSNDRIKEMIEVDKFYNEEEVSKIIDLAKSRSTFPQDMHKIVSIFNRNSCSVPEKLSASVPLKVTTESVILLDMYFEGLRIHPADWNKESIDKLIEGSCTPSMERKKFMPTLRKLIAYGVSGPDVISIMDILGRNESLHRISLGLLTNI